MVGNGNHVHCEGFCQSVVLNLQNTSFTIPFFVLPIEGANVVLGGCICDQDGISQDNGNIIPQPVVVEAHQRRGGRSPEIKKLSKASGGRPMTQLLNLSNSV
nr:Ty3/gypsy retrotransposon protein [Tanacetum cinerariifolium]